MLRALFEAGIRPDLVVGTSVGAVNAALVAAFPGAAAVDRLVAVWNGLARTGVFGAFLFGRIGTAIRSGTHLYSSVPLRALLESSMPGRRIEDLEMPSQCVAASIEPCGGGMLRRGARSTAWATGPAGAGGPPARCQVAVALAWPWSGW
jgi:NTE family protein